MRGVGKTSRAAIAGSRSKTKALAIVTAAMGAGLMARSAQATSGTWTGLANTNTWATAGNWTGGVPSSGNIATFKNAAGSGGAIIDLGSGVTVAAAQGSNSPQQVA